MKFRISGKASLLAFALLLTGCATSISYNVQRPPNMDTLGIQRIAVLPFEISNNNALQRQSSVWLTNEARNRIQATGYFTLVDPSIIERIQKANENLENHVDALFKGQIIYLTVKDTSRESERFNYKTEETYKVTVYQRDVEMEYNYSFVKTRDGNIIGPVIKTDKISATDEERFRLKSPEMLAQEIITRSMVKLAADVAPYYETVHRSLMKESSKDKIIKQRAKDAGALAKGGNYKAAQEAFIGIYRDTQSFAAAYNAGLLISAQGNLDEAAAFMQSVYGATGNPKALDELARVQGEIQNVGIVAAYSANQGQRDKLIAYMTDVLPPRMPQGAKVAVINNSRNERQLADTIANGIISGLIDRRIEVVERTHHALVEAEKNYQLSGNVSDDDLVSIGNEAGANTFVLVGITGSFSTRRLFVRMLDVARNTIIYQSPQTNEMNL